jgi:Xaa-Pro aminopeptidase
MQLLSPDSILILWSAPERVYSGDVNYPYRQDSNFFYLTGIEQPESIVVVLPGNKTQKEYLFIRPREPFASTGRSQSLG